MCGRIDTRDIQFSFFEIKNSSKRKYAMSGKFNLAPTSIVPIIKIDAEGEREMVEAVWDLKPSWANENKRLLHNARCETVHSLPSFRSAFKTRRCLVAAAGYFEWRKSDKQPFFFTRKDENPLAFAGIYEGNEEGGYSACIITTIPNAECAAIHDRMPVVLRREFWNRWLEPDQLSEEERLNMLVPAPDNSIQLWPVDRAVGSVKNDNPGLIERADETPLPTKPKSKGNLPPVNNAQVDLFDSQ